MNRMFFIKLDPLARDHRKVYALARTLSVEDATAFGYMCALWSWAALSCQNGDLNTFPSRIVANRCGFYGVPDLFISALKSVDLVDENGYIHNWDKHIGGDINRLGGADSSTVRSRRCRWNKECRALGLPELKPGEPVPYGHPTPPPSEPDQPECNAAATIYKE